MSLSFSRNLYSYHVLELKFEIRGQKLLPAANFSLILSKTKRNQRPSTFLVVATCQKGNDVITLK